MKPSGQTNGDVSKGGGWLTRFSKACLRIASMSELGSILQEVIDSACVLTGARYGVLLTFNESGGVGDLITSGITLEERLRLGDPPKGLGLLGFLNEIEGPLRLADISGHPSSVGFPENHPPMKTFLGSPLRFQGERIGNIYLTEKKGGGEFSQEDEELLVMFAAHAAVAIANSRLLSEAQRTRADLEALLNISPVGILVFDGKTGVLKSANDETRRVFGSLKQTSRTLEEIIQVVPLRRANGSDIPVEEIPPMRALKKGESVSADEVVFHLPDGRGITTLVNARPVYGEDGNPMSVVATIQDISPLEEIKRQRAEFLGDVSHQLRTPLAAIKGSTSTLLSLSYPPGPTETRQFLRVIDEQADRMHNLINDLVDMTQIETGTLSVNAEPVQIADLLEEARDAHVRAAESSGSVELVIPSTLPRVMADRRRILHVLRNLLVEVSGYSSRSPMVRISASPSDFHVAVTVENQGVGAGSGSPQQQLERISSVAAGVAERANGTGGLGIAICEGIVEAHGGRLSVKGEGGRGNGFTFTLPLADDAALAAGTEPGLSGANLNAPRGQIRILAIIENPETGRYVRNTLLQGGFTAVVIGDLDEAERLIENQKPRVVILEPTLAGAERFEALVRVRGFTDAPIIVVAGHGWEQHIGHAFELGASDYITLPCTSSELLARVGVALRMGSVAGWREPSSPYLYGDLVIDYLERQVTVAGRPVHLTATEYKLLTELAMAAGRVLSHERLLSLVWGPLHNDDPRIVRTYVKELRRKLGDDAVHPTYIFTRIGVGYRMPRPATAEQL